MKIGGIKLQELIYLFSFSHLDSDGDYNVSILDAYRLGLEDANKLIDLKLILKNLYKECEHGDDEYRKWLKDKFDDFYKRITE